MDSSSIITQVNRDDELLNGFAAPENGKIFVLIFPSMIQTICKLTRFKFK